MASRSLHGCVQMAMPMPTKMFKGHGFESSLSLLPRNLCGGLSQAWKKQHSLRLKRVNPCSRVRCAMDASFGDETTAFSRMNVSDPYKRLGISKEASEEEINEARKFLINQYGGHKKSREAIESAYDKIVMQKFRERTRPKINIGSNMKKAFANSPPWFRNLANIVETPSNGVILQNAAFFAFLALWSIMFSSPEVGPAFQVLVSFVGCIYLLKRRLNKVWRACLFGFIGFVVGWVVASCLITLMPASFLPPSWSTELTSSLISYVFLWLSSTYLK